MRGPRPSTEAAEGLSITGRPFLRSSVLYIVASAAAPAVALLLLPILTRILTPEDFGVLGLLAATVGVLGSIVGLNPNLMITARFAVLSKREIESLISASAPIALATALLAWPLLEGLGSVWPPFDLPPWAFPLLATMAATAVFRRLGLTVLQMTHRPRPYVAVEVGGAIVAGLATVWLVAGVGLDWRGQFLADAVVMIVLGIALAAWLRRAGYLRFTASAAARRDLVRFSAPLAVHGLGFWAINAQDRYFVAAIVGVSATGIYTVAYGLGSALNLIHTGVLRAFNPHFYERARLGRRQRIAIVRFTYGYVAASIVGLALFLGSVWLVVPVFLGPAFISSLSLIPWVALGYTFNAVRNLMAGYLFIAEHTRLIGALTLSAAVLNALLNLLFIRLWGVMGAAIATTLTFAYLATVTTVFAVRSHPMPWVAALQRDV